MVNPYQSPVPFTDPKFGQPSNEHIKQRVLPLAIVLLIINILGMLLAMVGLLLNLLGVALIAADANPQGLTMMAEGTFGIIQAVVALGIGGVIIYGCLKMMKLENHTLSTVACLLSGIPCIAPCCLFGLPVAIWGLILLNNAEVKAAFRG